MMKRGALFLSILFLIILIFNFNLASAKTSCDVKDCKITITIFLAFAGATDSQINSWSQEISNVWNGNGQTTGDCKCPVTFKVNTTKVANCSPMPSGYHCIQVLPWNGTDASLPQLPAGPNKGKAVVAYMGKTTQSPSVGGASLDGEWSNITSRPIDPNDPSKGNYLDAAHEVGHMLGLADGSGGLMNFTSGNDAKPTQQHIDDAVNNVCGSNACPDKCCCGNGIIDNNKGEQCDPKAVPRGCSVNDVCCPICCQCDLTRAQSFNLTYVPLGMFSNERINFYSNLEPHFHIITSNNQIIDAGKGKLENPTINVFSDDETFNAIHDGEISFIQAMNDGRLIYEGEGFFNKIKFKIISFLVDAF